MKLAIVILNWNGKKMLEQYLPSVIKYSSNYADIFVADNASTDDSIKMLESKFPEIKIIALNKNFGFAEGYNQALKEIEAEYFLLLNSDVRVTESWLVPLIDYMDKHPDVAACQPKLLSIHHPNEFEYAGAAGGFVDKFGYPFCRGRVFDVIEEDKGQYDSIIDIMWATGACLFIRSKDFWDAGAFDGRFFAHNEEIDLCWRLRLKGKRIVCIPYSKVYHVGGGTLPKKNPMKTFLNFRNNLTMLYKNLPDKEFKQVMRVRYFLDYLAAWQTLIFNRNIDDFKAIYKARKAFKKWRHAFDEDRKSIQQQRVNKQINERKNFSILYQFYIHGRRTYNTIMNFYK